MLVEWPWWSMLLGYKWLYGDGEAVDATEVVRAVAGDVAVAVAVDVDVDVTVKVVETDVYHHGTRVAPG
jgi:hypothetical protein